MNTKLILAACALAATTALSQSLPASSPSLNWEANSDDRWTVPIGGGVGKIQRIGKLPVNFQLGAYWNAVKPDNGPDWQLRFQVQFMLPK